MRETRERPLVDSLRFIVLTSAFTSDGYDVTTIKMIFHFKWQGKKIQQERKLESQAGIEPSSTHGLLFPAKSFFVEDEDQI